MSFPFQVIEHESSCQHLREYPNGLRPRSQGQLKLAIKQYKPLHSQQPSEDAVTILAAHANGFPKVSQVFIHIYLRKGSRIFTDLRSDAPPE